MHRKIELQAPADYTYLYANTINLSRQKLDLHLPPSATTNDGPDPDPMRERVHELVDEVSPLIHLYIYIYIYIYIYYTRWNANANAGQYITKTFTTASTSINVNGLDDEQQFPLPPATSASEALTAPAETVEYEAFDTNLAARVTSLYAQLESLTTTVAQLRRDAPRRAAGMYAEELGRVLETDEEDESGVPEEGVEKIEEGDGDVEMSDLVPGRRRKSARPDWKIEVPLGSEQEAERWRNGEMAEVYEDALRTLLRLQGEADDETVSDAGGTDGNALATTVGKAERAGRATEVVEEM